MERLRDSTGRSGPATWELGSYAEGQDEYPVGGISWFEAAAYARFVGKSLPTFYHWRAASGMDDIFSDVLRVSQRSEERRVGNEWWYGELKGQNVDKMEDR